MNKTYLYQKPMDFYMQCRIILAIYVYNIHMEPYIHIFCISIIGKLQSNTKIKRHPGHLNKLVCNSFLQKNCVFVLKKSFI